MKRFTETCKWDDSWFRGLTGVQKLCFLYVIDRCNNAGFWEVDEDSMVFHTKLSAAHISGAWQGLARGLIFADGWVWVRRFLRHQKNEKLNHENNAHKQIILLIQEQLVRFGKCPEFEQFLAPQQPLFRGSGTGKVKVQGKRGAGEKGEPVIPDELKTEEFLVAWADYLKYRSGAKLKPLQVASIESQMREFVEWGQDAAIAAIEQTIRKGWQGIFHPDRDGAKPAKPAGMFLTK